MALKQEKEYSYVQTTTILMIFHLATNFMKIADFFAIVIILVIFVKFIVLIESFNKCHLANIKKNNMNIPHSFNMLPEMRRARQELQILRKLRIFTVFVNLVDEFNPGHISRNKQVSHNCDVEFCRF